MGGRGAGAGYSSLQISMAEMQKQKKIEEIIEESGKIRNNIISNSSKQCGKGVAQLFKECQCCRNYSIHAGGLREACPICDWIDDPYQNTHPDSLKGKNKITLHEARKAYNRVVKEKRNR